MLSLFKLLYLFFILIFLFFLLYTKTSPRRLLCMIFILLNFAVQLLFLHYEYVAFIIIILYIGAISVLFLFIIMFVNISRKLQNERTLDLSFFLYFFFLGMCFWKFFLSNIIFLESSSFFVERGFFVGNLGIFPFSCYVKTEFGTSFFEMFDIISCFFNFEMEQLGFLFWTSYNFLVILSGFILIVSIIGSVSVLKGIFSFNLYKKKFLSSTLQRIENKKC